MATSKLKKRPRKKGVRKTGPSLVRLWRLVVTVFLVLILVSSITVVGYVIFFRTVFARDIPVDLQSMVFEEPDPPQHQPPAQQRSGDRPGQLPKVAIIIDDMGYHQRLGEQMLALPFALSYSFLPFVAHSRHQAVQAHRAGKTVMLHLPMQPRDSRWNPGPGALLVDDAPEVRREKFARSFGEVPHATGVNNHMGSLFTENNGAMDQVMTEIAARSLFFVDSYTTSASIALQVADRLQVKSVRRDVFLDNILDQAEICLRLEELVGIAEQRGWGVGIAHPHRATVEALGHCAPQYQSRVEYVGIGAILAGPSDRPAGVPVAGQGAE